MKRIKNKIKNEINNNIPDLKDEIINKIDWEEVSSHSVKNKEKLKKVNYFRYIVAPVCALLILCVGICTPIFFKDSNSKNNKGYTITISVNPNIELTVGENDIVTSQKALNEDGIMLLYKNNVCNKSINIAIKEIVNLYDKSGYLVNGAKIEYAVVDNITKKQNIEKQTELKSVIKQSLPTTYFDIDINNLTESKLDEIEDYYDNNTNKLKLEEKELIKKFNKELFKIATEQVNNTNLLIEELNKYLNIADLENEEQIIIKHNEFGIVADKISEYANDYNFDMQEFGIITQISYKDLFDLVEDLNDKNEDLNEFIEEYNDLDGESEEDLEIFIDALEDLFDDVKDNIKNSKI